MPTRHSRRPGELAFTALLLLASVWLFWRAYGISGLSGLSTAGVFPMVATGLMVVSAASILVATARRPRAGDMPGGFLRQVTPLRHAVLLGMVAAYVLLLPWFGFLTTSGAFIFASIAFLWRRSLLVTLVLSAATLAAIYVIFRLVFRIVLPSGSLVPGML